MTQSSRSPSRTESASRTVSVDNYLDFDSQLTADERDTRELVRRFCDKWMRDTVPVWYERGLPEQEARDLMREFGKLGVLGMHLSGYGCPGAGAVSYGLACAELEAVDSGLRSMVSVQGSLSTVAIHRYGSEEQKRAWLPRMAAGAAIGCFGLSEPDAGSDPGSMRTAARRDGPDWVLSGAKMWITNGAIADVAVIWARTEDGIRRFLVPAGSRGCTAMHMRGKLSMRASITSELILDDVRLPADAQLPGARGLRGPLSCLDEARLGIVFGVLGPAGESLRTAVDYACTRNQFCRPVAAFQLTQRKLVEMQEYPIMRHMANLESVLTYEGTAEVHTLVVGQALTGRNAFC